MRTVVIFIICSLCLEHIWGQEFPLLKFSRITEKDGLSNNDVHAIAQDRQGFIWIATADGLNRLDGYRIKTFYHHPADSNSLVNNNINDMLVDNKNNVWIGTVEGVSCYNTSKNSFANFRHKQGDIKSLRADDARALYFDSVPGNIYVNVANTVYRFDEDLNYTAIPLNKAEFPAPLQHIAVNYLKMYEDRQHQLWTCFANWIFKLDRQTKAIVAGFHTTGFYAQSLFEDDNNHYWVGTFGEGLLQFNPNNNTFKKVNDNGNSLFIYSICEWKDKNAHNWIITGTDRGLVFVDPQTLHTRPYAPDALNDYSTLPGNIYCLFVDRQNILWAGTENGVSYIEPSRQLIEAWDITTVDDKLKGWNDFAYSFFEDSSGYYSGCWRRPGLFHYNKSGNLVNTMPNLYPQGPVSLHGATAKAYAITKLNNGIFLFSVDAGLIEYVVAAKHSILYATGDGYSSPGLRTMLQYDDSIFWIRTRNNGPNGIYVYNSRQKKMRQHYFYIPGCTDCLPPNLHDIIITKNKNIFTSPADNYLYIFDRQQNKFIPFFTSEQQTAQLPSKTFDCMAEDADGNLWIGTSNGLFELDTKTKKVLKDYSKDKKLGGIGIEALRFDDDRNLWMNTERGLFCLTNNTHRVLNFNRGDGLPVNALPGFLYKGMNGYMYAGALGYIIKFRPSELLHQEITGPVQLSEITVMNKPCSITTNTNNEQEVILKPGQNIFTIDFSVLNYDNAAGNHYYYKLEGTMKEWKENEIGHLSFYDLPKGEYVLHLKGGDKYGNQFAGEASIAIDVVPYWWQTKWFYTVLALFLSVITYLLVIRRIKNIRKESSLKEKIAEAEMIALRAQMNPHFIFNCMNIIDGLITGNRREEAKNFLQKFSKLIRLVLENSQHQLVPLSSDLKTLQLYTEMEAIRYNHRFAYEFNIDGELLDDNYKIPPLLLQPYVENAIVHGLRHKEDGPGKLIVSMKNENGKLSVWIEDNGVGRKRSAEINKENHKSHKQIGMQVTEKRIELLRTINPADIQLTITDLNDKKETGTIVHLTLPLDFDTT